MQEISTLTLRGSFDTSTVSLAGGVLLSKFFPYSEFTIEKSSMLFRKIVVLTTSSKDIPASFKTALVGGNLATLAENNGWSGLVIYGCIRDSHEIKTVNIGCKALGSTPRKSAKAGSGNVNISLQVGGITVKPGSYVYCDLDGIVLASQRLF